MRYGRNIPQHSKDYRQIGNSMVKAEKPKLFPLKSGTIQECLLSVFFSVKAIGKRRNKGHPARHGGTCL
jgi:hypothetical protein